MSSNKRGQFYLVAAIIIISLIIGFVATSNYITQSEQISRIYDLGEEISIEGTSILDYGIYAQQDTESLIENFTKEYKNYEGNLYFIYGSKERINVGAYSDLEEKIEVKLSGEENWNELGSPQKFEDDREKWSYSSGSLINYIRIDIKSIGIYSFEIKEGENFYFILQNEVGGEELIVVK